LSIERNRWFAGTIEAVKQRLLRHRSLTHHRPTLRMLAMSESVDRRYFKAVFSTQSLGKPPPNGLSAKPAKWRDRAGRGIGTDYTAMGRYLSIGRERPGALHPQCNKSDNLCLAPS
jgi:hypothetical protein